MDTLQSSTSRIYIDNNASGRGHSYTGKVFVRFPLGKLLSFELGSETGYVYTRSERTSMDMLAGTVDTNNTFDYKIYELNNTLNGGLYYRDNNRKKGFSAANISASWTNQHIRRNEYFPEAYEFPRTFNQLFVTAQLEYKLTELNKLNLQYSRFNYPINLTDLREVLDDRNPVMLRVGNPRLKIPACNSMRFEGKFIKNSHTYGIVVNYQLYENTIVDKVRYFTSDTYIPEFNYMAMAGSSLITKENLQGKSSLWTEANYSKYASKIQSTLNIKLSYMYEHRPDYINEEPAVITSNTYRAMLKIAGGFSSVFEPDLSYYSTYSDFYNGMVRNKEFTQTVYFNIHSLIAKKWEINYVNQLDWNLRWPNVPGIDHFGLVSTLSFGYRLRDGLTVKATVNDLFNDKVRFSSDTYSDYISTSYTRQIGRYILLGAEWKF